MFPKYPPEEEIENDVIFDIPYLDIEDFGTSGASSLITHGSSEEDGEPELVGHFEDVSSCLDGSPERIVPIGPDHQARIPPWVGHMKGNEEKYLGTCIIPMPDDSASEIAWEIVGGGRTDCSCADRGSRRCVRQHVVESQENLESNLDDEKLNLLGLVNLGEEVACEWSEEEEQLFNEVVFLNPASAGKNFWRHLSATFPSRTKWELVSYYFNVFMLRKRATQNRCRFPDIDSDDDEWHGNIDEVPKEVQEFPHPSLGYKNQSLEQGKICAGQDEDVDSEEYGDVDNDEDEMRHCYSYSQEAFTAKPYTDNTFGNGEEITNVLNDFFGFQDDSCTSFDYIFNPSVDIHGPIDGETALYARSRGDKSCNKSDGVRVVDDTNGIGWCKSKESRKCSDIDSHCN